MDTLYGKKPHPHTRYHTILFLAVHTVKANETYSRGVRSNYKVYIKALKLCINCTTDVPFTVLQAKVYSRFVHFFLSFFLYTCTANLKRVTIMQMYTHVVDRTGPGSFTMHVQREAIKL